MEAAVFTFTFKSNIESNQWHFVFLAPEYLFIHELELGVILIALSNKELITH